MYKIVKNSSYNNDIKVLLETSEINEVLFFYNKDLGDVELLKFDDILKEFNEYIENWENYDISLKEYIKNMVSIGEIYVNDKDIKDIIDKEKIIIRAVCSNSGDSKGIIVKNTKDDIILGISDICDIFGEETTPKGVKSTYELIIEE